MAISGIYAALCALLLLVLSVRISLRRNTEKIGIGTGQDEVITRRIRVQGNFVEYVPMALVLLLLLETNHTAPWLLHSFGVVLVVSRIAHAIGLGKSAGTSPGRLLGTAGTWLLLLVMSLLLLWQFLLLTSLRPG